MSLLTLKKAILLVWNANLDVLCEAALKFALPVVHSDPLSKEAI